jgi:hypothetical protein
LAKAAKILPSKKGTITAVFLQKVTTGAAEIFK